MLPLIQFSPHRVLCIESLLCLLLLKQHFKEDCRVTNVELFRDPSVSPSRNKKEGANEFALNLFSVSESPKKHDITF